METTIPLPLVPFVDIPLDNPFQKGITREQVASLGCIYFAVQDSFVKKLLGFLKQHVAIQSYVNVTAITSTDDVLSILDSGARKIFVQPSQYESFKSYGDRVALAAPQDGTYSGEISSGGILISSNGDMSGCESLLQKYAEAKASPSFLLADSGVNLQACIVLAKQYSAVVVVPSSMLTMENNAEKGCLSVPMFIGSSWTSDRSDNLIPTIVTDERGIALGLVYSSQESLAESLKTGTGM